MVSFGMVSFFTEFTTYAGGTRSFFDVVIHIFYDTILPLNGFLLCMFVSYRWKKKNLSEELSIGNENYKGSWIEKYVIFSLGTFIPVIVLSIFLNTVALKFFAFSLFCDAVRLVLIRSAFSHAEALLPAKDNELIERSRHLRLLSNTLLSILSS